MLDFILSQNSYFYFFNSLISSCNSLSFSVIERLGIDENKLSVIPNAFNSSLFYPMDKDEIKRKLNLPLDKNLILNVGNLYPVKGQGYLIEAVKELVKHRKDILCIIIGDGPNRYNLKSQIKKLGLEKYVKLAGVKKHDESPFWMNAADLFVFHVAPVGFSDAVESFLTQSDLFWSGQG